MKRIWSIMFSKPCLHEHTLVVRSVGVQRRICANCGHVGFSISPTLVGNTEPAGSQTRELPEAAGL